MNKPNVYLHPASASSPDTIRIVEEATGLVAVPDRRRPVVRLVPVLRVVKSEKVSA